MNLQGVVFGVSRNENGAITELHYALQQIVIAETVHIESVELILHEPNTGNVGHTLLVHANGCEFVGDIFMPIDLKPEHDELTAFAASGGTLSIRFPKPQTAKQQLEWQAPEMELHHVTATVYDGHLDHILNAASL